MKGFFAILSLLLLLVITKNITVNAQQLPLYSSYMFTSMTYNSGYAGYHKIGLDMTGVFRTQYLNVNGAPSTSLLMGHSRVGESKSSVGGIFYYDKIGAGSSFAFFGIYSYHLPLTDKVSLGLGVQAGGINYSNNYSTLNSFSDALNPTTSTVNINKDDTSSTNFNLGIGLYLHSDIFFVGLSAPLLVENSFTNNIGTNTQTASSTIKRHYFASAGYVFPISPYIKMRPTAYIRYVEGVPLQSDINIMGIFYDKIWVGATYRTSQALVLVAQVSFLNQYRIAYSFDLFLSQASSHLGNGHEITLNVLIGKKQILLDNPRYF